MGSGWRRPSSWGRSPARRCANRAQPGALRPGTADAVLAHGEIRVLYYLPTNLSAREIACELYLSVNTVKTHQRHLYQKLGACIRSQAVERARALGLLRPSSRASACLITPT